MMTTNNSPLTLLEYQSHLSRNHIRLLNLYSQDEGENLRCDLETVRFTDDIAYEAISYVWGDENDRVPLEIIQHNGSSAQFSITLNLAIALNQVRNVKSRRRLWVDSICINQNNIDERNEQVIIMGEIYRNAEAVLISLGDDGPENTATYAVRCMQSLIQAEETHEELRGNRSIKSSWVRSDGEFSKFFSANRNTDINEKFNIPSLTSPEFLSLRKFFQCSWFTRAWTWQESHVAAKKTFYWGKESWPGTSMPKVVRILARLTIITGNEEYWFGEIVRAAPMLAFRDFWRDEKQLEFRTIISVRRASGCKFPSDLVYSLLGAATRCPKVTVDYDLPFEQVFTQVAKQLIVEYHDFSVLGLIDGPRQRSSLPSWVPDWREKMAATGMTGINDPVRYAYNIASKPRVKLLSDMWTLEVEGISLDTISAIRDSSISEDAFIANNFESKIYLPTGELVEIGHWRSRCRDFNLFEPDEPRARWDSEAWERMQRISANAHDIPNGRRDYAAMITAVAEANRDTVLFKTAKGYMGFGRPLMRKDDVVVRFFGGHYPLILRPTSETEKYAFVSESYVHGLMDGEVVIGRDTTVSGQQIFQLI